MPAELASWNQIRDAVEWESILIGNGASRAVWDKFEYGSLYKAASSGNTEFPLAPEDIALFDALGTTNFEQVLSDLLSADQLLGGLGIAVPEIRLRYESIRQALAAAVQSVHIPWGSTPDRTLADIGEALKAHEYVFSTNYDLLLYWAIMNRIADQGPVPLSKVVFKDYFWARDDEDTTAFRISNTNVIGTPTRVLFLHGGLHLVRRLSGETHKLCNQDMATILERFGDEVLNDAVPLVVTEGSAAAKLATIQQSDYLSFAIEQLSKRRGALVVFGHALAAQDQHLVDAIYTPPDWLPPRLIAVSMRPANATAIAKREAELEARLPNCTIQLFDATTHPIGHGDLKKQTASPVAKAG